MPLFRKKEPKGFDYKARLEHKLYLARENPEPVFDLSDCDLKAVPAGIYSLCKVFRKEILYLQENHLTSLAGGGRMQDLVLLQVLDLHSNSLSVLPDDIRYLKHLKELNIAANQLIDLPEVIGELENLEKLIVAENSLKCLPNSIGNLHHLQHLDICHNVDLVCLPTSLCNAAALKELLLTPDNYTYPPKDVLHEGTAAVMKFLAAECGLNYESLQTKRHEITEPSSSSAQQPIMEEKEKRLEAKILQLERLKEQKNKERLALERIMEEQHKKELDLRVAMKHSKEKLLEDLIQQQTKLESEILRIRQDKEAERQQLLQELQQEERASDAVVSQLLALNSSERNSVYLQQILQHEKQKEEWMFNVQQDEYRSLRRRDILSAMERLLEEECLRKKKLQEYEEGRWQSTKTLLDQEMESSRQQEEWLIHYSQANSALVGHLQKDEELQRAAVAALLERSDTRSWGLVQQVRLVESQLAALTALEMKRCTLRVTEHMEDLCKKRIALSDLLMNLLEQQDIRRQELLRTLKEMDKCRWIEQEQEEGRDYWLLQYQRLLDSRSGSLMQLECSLDPALAHQLIFNGVIHYLPFLSEWLTVPNRLIEVTDDSLTEVGIRSSEIRQAVLKAIENYLKEISERVSESENVRKSSSTLGLTPSAPLQPEVELASDIGSSECVVCMECKREIIFVPCGHMCCCIKCSELVNDCPMCRSHIDQKVRVILS